MKKLFIFDFDGTIFDSIDDVIECFNKALNINKFPTLTKSEYIKCLGGNIDELTSLILGNNNTLENIELVKNTYVKIYTASLKEKTVPFTGIVDILSKFQDDGIILAINSNRKTYSIQYFADKFLKDIDFISLEGYNDDYPSKPDPTGVRNIVKKAGVKLSEVLYIGDTEKDIQTAKNAGVDCVIVKWGYGNSDDWKNDYILKTIDKVSDLSKLVSL